MQPTQARDESVWEETSFPARPFREAPRFVPATISHEDSSICQPTHGSDIGASVAGWYRSVTRKATTAVDHPSPATQSTTRTGPSGSCTEKHEIPNKRVEARNKNNWFILRAIESEPSSVSSTALPLPTLADILARDPPCVEGGYSPPVWLTLGPSNKGFTMLQQRGWNEGEGLGPRVRRRAPIGGDFLDAKNTPRSMETWSERKRITAKEIHEVEREDGVQDMQNVDVIDLTLSDSDEVQESGLDLSDYSSRSEPMRRSPSPHSPSALLTPIATVLKSDRLGIGLRAKTIGPHKASRKRVTHGAAALAAHIKAAEETRKKKAAMGHGWRGFAKMAKKERESRQKMLADLNE